MAKTAAQESAADSVESAGPDPLEIPENKEKFELAKEFAFHLANGIKNIGIYRHNTSKYGEMLQKAYEAVTKFAQKWGALPLKVEAECFSMFKQPVFSATERAENLPYKFYRDGIRHLVFRADLTLEELVEFVLIGLGDPNRGDQEVLAQLWARSFEHIEYMVVEGFSVDDSNEEDVKVEVEKIVGYLYQRLRSNSEDFLRFARVSVEDLEMQLDGVYQVRGAVVAGTPAGPKLVQQIQEEIEEDVSTRLFPKLVNAIFQTIDEGGLTESDVLREIFLQLLDSMLLQEDFGTINGLVVKFRAMERDPAKESLATELREFFVSKMGEEQRLRRIGDVLNSSRPKQPQDVFRYLYSLDTRVIPTLLDILETVEIPDNRTILCDALASLGKEMPEPFVNRLNSEKSQLVRDMIYIIDKCDFPDKMKYFGETLKNPNLAVRLEVLQILARSKSELCRRFIVQALSDGNVQMRMQAARLLPTINQAKAFMDLSPIVKSADFEKKDMREKTAFFQALGSTMQQPALGHFVQMLGQKSLLRRQKLKEDKLLAIAGLSAMPSIPAYKTLQAVTEDKGNDTEILVAARRALHGMKKELFGDGPEGDNKPA